MRPRTGEAQGQKTQQRSASTAPSEARPNGAHKAIKENASNAECQNAEQALRSESTTDVQKLPQEKPSMNDNQKLKKALTDTWPF